jgi:hypothetical protein
MTATINGARAGDRLGPNDPTCQTNNKFGHAKFVATILELTA